jgi:hypothetical protein
MSKTVCKKKKAKPINKPKFQCKKCDGMAEKKKNLCKPAKI